MLTEISCNQRYYMIKLRWYITFFWLSSAIPLGSLTYDGKTYIILFVKTQDVDSDIPFQPCGSEVDDVTDSLPWECGQVVGWFISYAIVLFIERVLFRRNNDIAGQVNQLEEVFHMRQRWNNPHFWYHCGNIAFTTYLIRNKWINPMLLWKHLILIPR